MPNSVCHPAWYTQEEEGFPSSPQTWRAKREQRHVFLLQRPRSAAGTALRFTCLVGIISLKSSPGGQSFNFSTIGWPSSDLSRSARNKLTFHPVTLSHHSPLPCSSSKSFVPRRLTLHSKTDPDFPLGFQALSQYNSFTTGSAYRYLEQRFARSCSAAECWNGFYSTSKTGLSKAFCLTTCTKV